MTVVRPGLINVVALQVDINLGWLPDAIWRAAIAIFRTIMGQGISELLKLGVVPLLKVPNPTAAGGAITAWQAVFGVAITLLPILIATGVIVTPFSPDQKASLWRQALRVVAVIFFIAISKPVIGFAVDATNAITVQLAPGSFTISFAMHQLKGWAGQFVGWTIGLIIYVIAFGGLLIAVVITSLLLALRIYLVYFLFIAAPLLIVLWYADWGPLESVSSFGAMFMRIGVYALLAGPIVALMLRVAKVISTGGLITNAAGSNPASQFWASLVIVLIIPILLIIGVWQSISYAGQPLGVGKMASMGIATVATMAGVAVGGKLGSALGSKFGSGRGGSGGGVGSGGSGTSGGGSGGGGTSPIGTDPAAGTGNSMVGTGISHDLDDVVSDANQTLKEELAPHLEAPYRTESKLKGQRVGGGIKKLVPESAKQAGSTAKGWGSKAVGRAKGKTPDVNERISGWIQETQNEYQIAAEAAAYHGSNMEFLDTAMEEGEFDVGEAADRSLLAFDPTSTESVPVKDGIANVEYAPGKHTEVNLNALHSLSRKRFDTALADAQTKGRQLRQIEKAPGVARSVGRSAAKVPLKAGKTGALATAGALSGHPYFAYRIGKGGGQRDLILAPDSRTTSDQTTQEAGTHRNMDSI